MEKHTLKIYDTEATIYEYTFEEHRSGAVKVVGIPEEARAEGILFGRQYEASAERKASSYVAKGFSINKYAVVIADNINQKQLANILIAIGMEDGVAYEVDINQVCVKEIAAEDDTIEEVANASAEIKKKDKKRKRK